MHDNQPATDPETNISAHHGHFPGWAWDWFLAVVMALFATFVLTTLDRNGIWTDELSHFNALHHIAPWVGRVHPLHLMIARADVLLFGFSDYALRLPWALIATLGLAAGYALGRLLGGRALGRLTCLLLATCPYYIHYARDANYYSELMTYALLGAWGAAAFIQTGMLLPAVIALMAMAAMTLTHPISGVCAVALGASMLIGLLGRRAVRETIARQFGGAHKMRSLVILAFCIVGAGVVGVRFGHLLNNVVGKAWSLLAWRGGFENLDLGWTVLASMASEYTGGVLGITRLSLLIAGVYAVAALVGVFALMRGGFWRSLPVLAPFVAMLLLLQFLKIDRFFHVRYTAYLAPLWMLLAASGALALGRGLVRLAPRQRWLLILPALALLGAQGPQLHHYATFDGGYLKRVMRYLKPVLKPGDQVLTIKHFGPKEEAHKAGIDTSYFTTLDYNYMAGQQRMQEACAKLFFARLASPWVLLHWNHVKYVDPELRRTLIGRATPMVIAPSVYELSSIQDYRQGLFYKPPVPVVQAELYRFNWPGRYVCAPQPYEVNLAGEEHSPAAVFMRQRGLLGAPATPKPAATWQSPFLFEKRGHYLLTLTPPSERPGLRYRCMVDDKELSAALAVPGAVASDSLANQFCVTVTAGEHRLMMEPLGPAQAEVAWLPTLRIEPDYARGVALDPLYITRTNTGNGYLRGEMDHGRLALVFDRNEAVHYDFAVRQAGAYRLGFEALEDKPGPVLAEIGIDGRAVGVLSWGRADHIWTKHTIIENLPVGRHTLTVSAVSEGDVGTGEPDLNNNLVLAGIEIAPAIRADTDDRLALASVLFPRPAVIAQGFASVGDKAGERVWTLTTYLEDPVDKGTRLTIEPDAGAGWTEGSVLHFSMSAQAADTKLVSPVFPVTPGKALYLRAEIRIKELLNHSANMQLLLYDKDMVPVDVIHVRAQGTAGTTDWVPYVYLDEIPEDAAYGTLACVVYQNGKMNATTGGEAWFRRLEFPGAGK